MAGPDEELDTVTGEIPDAAVTDSAPAGADTGDTGAEAKDEGPKSMLDAVMSTFDPAEKAEAKTTDTEASPASSEQEPNADPASDEKLSAADAAEKEVRESDYFPPEEWKRLGPKVRRRFDRLKEQNQALESELTEVRPIQETIREYGFTKEDVDLSFGLMGALRKGEFQTFIDGVTPYLDLAMEALGRKLPEDLQTKVDEGYVDPEIASELARTRFEAQLAKSQVGQVRQQEETRQATEHVERIRSSVAEWEGQVKLRDPDYSRKEKLIQKEAHRLVLERGHPRTTDEALALAKLAYENTNELVSSLTAGTRQATRPPLAGSARSAGTGNLRVEPKTMLEAMEAALARS